MTFYCCSDTEFLRGLRLGKRGCQEAGQCEQEQDDGGEAMDDADVGEKVDNVGRDVGSLDPRMTRAGDELGMAVDRNRENKGQHQLGYATFVERDKQSRVDQEEPGPNGEDGLHPCRYGEERCDVCIHGDDIGNIDLGECCGREFYSIEVTGHEECEERKAK